MHVHRYAINAHLSASFEVEFAPIVESVIAQ